MFSPRMTGRLATYALYALPAAAVAVVAFAVLVVGAPRPYVAARLRGGPTENVHTLAWRLEAFERLGDREQPLANRRVRVRARAGERSFDWSGTTDRRGAASVSIPLDGVVVEKPVRVEVTPERGAALAEGDVFLSVAEWRAEATRRGGLLPGPRTGTLDVLVAPGRGVFAVPFADPLLVEVRRDGKRVGGARVTVRTDGAKVTPKEATTDARGQVRVMVTPAEHAVSLSVRAASATHQGGFDGALPVIPGALWATRADGTLRIASPIVRDVAYVTLVSETARLAGAAVTLESDGRGGAVGTWSPPDLASARAPLWAVVSSEPDQHSMALVGWPVGGDAEEPSRTFAVPDQLLLDGAPAAFTRDAVRRGRARALAALFAISAMALAVVLLALRTRGATRDLEKHFEDAGGGMFAPAEVSGARDRQAILWVVAGLLCVALGFAAIALVAMMRM